MTILSVLGMMVVGMIIFGIISQLFYKTVSVVETRSMSNIRAGQKYENIVFRRNPKEKGKHIVTVTEVRNGLVFYINEYGDNTNEKLRFFGLIFQE